MDEVVIEKMVKEIINNLRDKNDETQPLGGSNGKIGVSSYPLGSKRPDLVKTPTNITKGISLKFPVGLTKFKALIAFSTKTLSLALLLITFIFSNDCSPGIGSIPSSFKTTTLAKTFGFKASLKNCTVPSSCLI